MLQDLECLLLLSVHLHVYSFLVLICVFLFYVGCSSFFLSFFFFNDTATTEIYTLSLHDALPICRAMLPQSFQNSAKGGPQGNFSLRSKFKFILKPSHLMANFLYISYLKTVLCCCARFSHSELLDRKSTRLNSSHMSESRMPSSA